MEYYAIVTKQSDYPLILKENGYYNKYNAGEELIKQINRFYPNVVKFKTKSHRDGARMREELLECCFDFPGCSNHIFYIYAFQVEGGGRSGLPHEQRLQIRTHDNWDPDLNTIRIANKFRNASDKDNLECYVIGIYKTGPEDDDVIFSGFYPNIMQDIETIGSAPVSKQLNINKIREAYLNNISLQDKGRSNGLPFIIVNFKPQNIFWYMENRDKLHLQDIEIASKLIKEVRTEPKLRTFDEAINSIGNFFSAIRTKPFLLLAGISGTGKSRIVREFAFKSCPKYLQDSDGTTPGNYCMIEVKPNWHDSTELLGYYSNLSKRYQFKKFVMFLVKAKMFPKVPFFVCLDEMNLAPVEQYFAEILSILETRKHPKVSESGEVDMSTIKTEVIVEAKHFRDLSTWSTAINQETGEPYNQNLTDRDIYMKLFDINEESDIDEELKNRTDLTTVGLTLPDNVIIVGTVNMDDTTHQFSRKVIDRAMTIEMNGGKLVNMYGGSKNMEYIENEEEQQKWQHSFSQPYVTADEVLEAHPNYADKIKEKLPVRLEEINMALKGTPFEVSYRVLNELTIMVGVMLDDKISMMSTIDDATFEDIVNQAVNNILLMKILPRIEGDAEMFALSKEYKTKMSVSYNDRLEWLKDLAPDINQGKESQEEDGAVTEGDPTVEEGAEPETKPQDSQDYQQTAKDKIQEMIDRLNNQDFTRFWP